MRPLEESPFGPHEAFHHVSLQRANQRLASHRHQLTLASLQNRALIADWMLGVVRSKAHKSTPAIAWRFTGPDFVLPLDQSADCKMSPCNGTAVAALQVSRTCTLVPAFALFTLLYTLPRVVATPAAQLLDAFARSQPCHTFMNATKGLDEEVQFWISLFSATALRLAVKLMESIDSPYAYGLEDALAFMKQHDTWPTGATTRKARLRMMYQAEVLHCGRSRRVVGGAPPTPC